MCSRLTADKLCAETVCILVEGYLIPPTPPRREVAQPNLMPNPPASVTNQSVPVGSGDSSSKKQT